MNKTSELPRLTFEDVLSNQIELTRRIGELIGKNRTLKPDEVEAFRQIYSRATLGKGALVTPNTNLPGIQHATLDNLVFNYLTVHKLEGIHVGWIGTDERQKLSPAKIWALVLSRLNADVFGAALQQAVALSPEKPGGIVFGGLKGKEKD